MLFDLNCIKNYAYYETHTKLLTADMSELWVYKCFLLAILLFFQVLLLFHFVLIRKKVDNKPQFNRRNWKPSLPILITYTLNTFGCVVCVILFYIMTYVELPNQTFDV